MLRIWDCDRLAFQRPRLESCPHNGHGAEAEVPDTSPVLGKWAVMRLRHIDLRLIPVDVSALSEARFQEELRSSTVLRRAFDKAVRRKPPVVAADAGPMQIQLMEGAASRCAEAVRQSTTDDTGRCKGDESAKLAARQGLRK